ncbi:MAG: HD domain-containing protein, partial [Lachnospiraceae bacterium]|nr:HD domain-containing protein [Lachnospiraceae bacterium]
DYKDGDRVFDIYLCKYKSSAMTKNGKPYENIVLQDKTGTIDGKIWEPNNAGIGEFEIFDYIEVYGDVSSFQGALQVSIKRTRKCKEGEYNAADYLPLSPHDIDGMYQELLGYVKHLENKHLKALLTEIFINDEAFAEAFRKSSAAKTIHHGFVGGLLHHTLSVVKMCEFYASLYPILKKDLLISAALCHDIGKTRELSAFPHNDYTDEGQFIGHIVMGSEMVGKIIDKIPDFPAILATELKHCILSHHGEFEYGSPKKPAIIEAVALNFADNTDAKLQAFDEIMDSSKSLDWQGYSRLFESNIIATRME